MHSKLTLLLILHYKTVYCSQSLEEDKLIYESPCINTDTIEDEPSPKRSCLNNLLDETGSKIEFIMDSSYLGLDECIELNNISNDINETVSKCSPDIKNDKNFEFHLSKQDNAVIVQSTTKEITELINDACISNAAFNILDMKTDKVLEKISDKNTTQNEKSQNNSVLNVNKNIQTQIIYDNTEQNAISDLHNNTKSRIILTINTDFDSIQFQNNLAKDNSISQPDQPNDLAEISIDISSYIMNFCNELAANPIDDHFENTISKKIQIEPKNDPQSFIQLTESKISKPQDNIKCYRKIMQLLTKSKLKRYKKINAIHKAKNAIYANKICKIKQADKNLKFKCKIFSSSLNSHDYKNNSSKKLHPKDFQNTFQNIDFIYSLKLFRQSFGLIIDNKLLTNKVFHYIYQDDITRLENAGYEHIESLCTYFSKRTDAQFFFFDTRIRELNKIIQNHSLDKKRIVITKSPDYYRKSYISYNNTLITDLKKLKDLALKTELESDFPYINFERTKLNYIEFIMYACMEYNANLKSHVLKQSLWGIHAYMAEFYFYIMWKIEKIKNTKYIDIKKSIILSRHLRNEIKAIFTVITKYDIVQNNLSDNRHEVDMLVFKINCFRNFILNHLKNNHPEFMVTTLYFLAVNIQHRKICENSGKLNIQDKKGGENQNTKEHNYCRTRMQTIDNLHYFNININVNRTKRNMMFISTFTGKFSGLEIIKLKNIKTQVSTGTKNLSRCITNYYNNNSQFMRRLIMDILKLIKFIKCLRNIDDDGTKALFIYTQRN